MKNFYILTLFLVEEKNISTQGKFIPIVLPYLLQNVSVEGTIKIAKVQSVRG